MTSHLLVRAAAVATPLLASVSASADFLGFEGTFLDTTIAGYGDVRVVRVYARFDDPDDAVLMVFGNPVAPLAITLDTGSFFQSIYGNNTAPNCAVLAYFDELGHDTFLDIGQATGEGPPPAFSPSFPSFGAGSLALSNGAWFRTPEDPIARAGWDGRTLIGQFTFPSTGSPTLSGVLNLSTLEGGVGVTRFGVTFTISEGSAVPRPCPADVNEDDTIDMHDLIAVLLNWGDCTTCGLGCPADIDGDMTVGASDVVRVVEDFGRSAGCGY